MSTAITPTNTSTALAIRTEQDFWDERQLAALSQLGLRNAPKGDLAVFFHQCKRTGLDAFARQIYMIERRGKYGIQTSIDGFRVIADRACALRGWVRSEEDTIWYDAAGKAYTEPIKNPAVARYTCVVLTPAGQARFSATARFDEYSAGGPMWSKMPALMIAKCAEALALRKAFPQDLSGLYTDDEMAQADARAQGRPVAVTRPAEGTPATALPEAPRPEVVLVLNEDGTAEVRGYQLLLLETIEGHGFAGQEAKTEARRRWTEAGFPMSGNADADTLDAFIKAVDAELGATVETAPAGTIVVGAANDPFIVDAELAEVA